MRQKFVSQILIRRGTDGDLAAVEAIQRACPQAAQWTAGDYLQHDFHVAFFGTALAGFIVLRILTQDEREILNLAVVPEWRRKGIAQALLRASLAGFQGVVFLEVRESNEAARRFYELQQFQEVSR